MLRTIDIHLSAICNLSCYYCYNNNSIFDRSHKGILSIDQLKKFLDLVLVPKYKDEVHYISFVGGEPLVFKDHIYEAFRYISEKYSDFTIKFNITTNGLLLSEEFLQKLQSFGLYFNFQLSAHAYSIKAYNVHIPAFENTIKLCNIYQVEYKILYLIDKNNQEDTLRNILLLAKTGAKNILPGIDCFFTKWSKSDYAGIVILYDKLLLLRKRFPNGIKILNLIEDEGTGLKFDRHTDGDSCMSDFQKDSLGILSTGDIFTCLFYTCVPMDSDYEKIKYGNVDTIDSIDFTLLKEKNYVSRCGFHKTGTILSALLAKKYIGTHRNPAY